MAKMKKAQMGYRVRGEGRSCGIERQARKDERQYDRENRKANRQADREIKRDERVAARDAKKEAKSIPKQRSGGKTPAWQRKEGKNPAGGLNAKGVASYRAANPGSKLKTAVTTKPSKLKKGSKAASRRKSFCARMSGMKKRLTSAKTANDPNSRINKSLRKWNC
jgi:hypothetical protein